MQRVCGEKEHSEGLLYRSGSYMIDYLPLFIGFDLFIY